MATDPPRRWVIPVALLPAVPVFSFLSLISLPGLRTLPAQWQWVLGLFAATQLVAAALTPDPLLSVPLALGRVLLTLGLILTGVRLGSSGALRPALIGYAVVAVTAFTTTTLLHPTELLSVRLQHPYLTQVSLGLAGTLGILLAVTWKGGPVLWRILAVSLSLGMFLWSGSRGPLIALAAGLLAALIVSQGRQLRAVLLIALGAAAVILGAQNQLPSTTGSVTSRFLENTLNGRGAYWADALDTARDLPLGGTGPYQLGPRLSTQYSDGSCNLWLKNDTYGLTECPPALNAARGAWLIAHNTLFHLLGETGMIGTFGWLALMGTLAVTAARTRDPLLNAITWAAAGIGIVDNPTLLPNIGHAELYWLSSGVAVGMTRENVFKSDAHLFFRKKSEAGFNHSIWQIGFSYLRTLIVNTLRDQALLSPVVSLSLAGYFSIPLWINLFQSYDLEYSPVVKSLVVPHTLLARETVSPSFQTLALAPNRQTMSYPARIYICSFQKSGKYNWMFNIINFPSKSSSRLGYDCKILTTFKIDSGLKWVRFNLNVKTSGKYTIEIDYTSTRLSKYVEFRKIIASAQFEVIEK